MSTWNKIVRGEEVMFTLEGIPDHFRRLAAVNMMNATNLSNLTIGTTAPESAHATTIDEPEATCQDDPDYFD
eukprot:5435654-Prymnesium_polylepis.1